MKRLLTLLASLLILQTISAYNFYDWDDFGPEGIKANKMVFSDGAFDGIAVIFVDSGMFIGPNGILVNNFEYLDLPANDARSKFQNGDTLFVTVSQGSYSDGIYSVNMQTFDYNIIKYCMNPNFLTHIFYGPDWRYYVGYESGLLESTDAYNWEEVPFFSGKNCVEMDALQGHKFVKTDSQLFISDNNGTWVESTGFHEEIHNLTFGPDNLLFGIFDGQNDSTGLWRSEDYGDTWSFVFNSLNISSLSDPDYSNLLLIGWQDAYEDYEGIATYDVSATPPVLNFFNDGLPNTNINDITCTWLGSNSCNAGNINPVTDFKSVNLHYFIFVSTDEGVFYTFNYLTGTDEQNISGNTLTVYPNPVSQRANIKISSSTFKGDNKIYIYNNKGIIVDKIYIEKPSTKEINIKWNKGDLPAGVYYLEVKSGNETISKKFIIL